MVKTCLFAILAFYCNSILCQIDSGEIGWMFEEGPQFSGDLAKFIQSNTNYPDSALADSIEGVVYVQYLVDTLGFTRNHEVVKGIRHDLDKEALRVAKLIKYDCAAKLRGRPVLFYFTIPIEFKLSNKENKKSSSSFCLSDSSDLESPSELVFAIESMPEFAGDLYEFIQSSINPASAKYDSVQGRVFVSFVVDTTGATIDHHIIKGIREDLDREAIRVAKLIRFEKPAMQRGKPIEVKYTVPIEFGFKNTAKKPKCDRRSNTRKIIGKDSNKK